MHFRSSAPAAVRTCYDVLTSTFPPLTTDRLMGMYLEAENTEHQVPATTFPRPGVDDRLELLPYYVYELRDPRNNEVFYVGKGTADRLDAHTAGTEDDKRRRIADIEAAGLVVSRIVIGRFETEAEAFAVESVLIKWVYGFANLTNQVHGHRERFIRSWELRASTEPIPGIDVERRMPGLRDGSFTAEQRRKIAQHGIVEKLEALRNTLANAEQLRVWRLQFSDVDLSRAGDPGIRVTGFSPDVHMNVDMQLSGDHVKVGLVPAGSGHREAFNRALTSIPNPFAIKNASRPGRYARPGESSSKEGGRGRARGIPYESTGEIIAQIERTLARLTDVRRAEADG